MSNLANNLFASSCVSLRPIIAFGTCFSVFTMPVKEPAASQPSEFILRYSSAGRPNRLRVFALESRPLNLALLVAQHEQYHRSFVSHEDRMIVKQSFDPLFPSSNFFNISIRISP